MILIQTILGNIQDEPWCSRLAGATLDRLDLDQWDAQKNRLRRFTQGGVEVAVSLERNTHMHDGDVLAWDAAAKRMIVAKVQLKDVMVIHLDGLMTESREHMTRTCVELGHALGNQHWPAVVKGLYVYVPLIAGRAAMDAIMKTHGFAGVTYEFARGVEVVPYLAPHEARRLFGGAGASTHTHPIETEVESTPTYAHAH